MSVGTSDARLESLSLEKSFGYFKEDKEPEEPEKTAGEGKLPTYTVYVAATKRCKCAVCDI